MLAMDTEQPCRAKRAIERRIIMLAEGVEVLTERASQQLRLPGTGKQISYMVYRASSGLTT